MRTHFPQHRQLANLELFAECTPAQIRTIAQLGTEVALSPGTPVWHEQRTEPQFIVVVHGEIVLTRAGEHITSLGAGAWFGNDALIRGLRAETFSGVVTTPTRLFAFSKREFRSLLRAAPTIAETLGHATALTVSSTHDGAVALVETTTRAWATRSPRRGVMNNLDPSPSAALTHGGIR